MKKIVLLLLGLVINNIAFAQGAITYLDDSITPNLFKVATKNNGLPIIVNSLPLPTGAALDSSLTTINSSIGTMYARFPAALDGSGFLKIHEQGTAAISAVSLPLPTGAAADSSLTTINNNLTTINSTLGTLITINTSIGTSNTNLGTLHTDFGTNHTDLGTLNTSIGTMSAKLPTTLDGSGFLKTHEQGTANVATTATENHIGSVGGTTISVTASFTRPADTNAYAALDEVSTSTSAPTVVTYTGAARISGGSGYITRIRLCTDQSTNVAKYKIHLYSSSTPTLINDNSPYTLLWSENSIRIASLDVPSLSTEGIGSTEACGTNVVDRIPFITNGSANIYGIGAETLDAFTPASAQNYNITLWIEQN